MTGVTSNELRDMQGVTATLRNQETGERVSLVRSGLVGEAAREIADVCDGLGADWKVLCLSTPRTILRDIQGTRNYVEGNDEARRVASTHYPETRILGAIGRMDLLDPVLT